MQPKVIELIKADINEMTSEELITYQARLRTLRKKDLRQVLSDEFYGLPEYEGFIYVLSNPAMPDILKIGCTSGTIKKRATELSSPSGVPEPFKIERTFPVYMNPKVVEKKVHLALGDCRINERREFFRIAAKEAMLRIQVVLNEVVGC